MPLCALQVMGSKIPQIQVAQGQEPTHFRRMFGQGRDHGRLIVHDRVWRKRDNPEKRVSLFKVQCVPEGEFETFQVGCRLSGIMLLSPTAQAMPICSCQQAALCTCSSSVGDARPAQAVEHPSALPVTLAHGK